MAEWSIGGARGSAMSGNKLENASDDLNNTDILFTYKHGAVDRKDYPTLKEFLTELEDNPGSGKPVKELKRTVSSPRKQVSYNLNRSQSLPVNYRSKSKKRFAVPTREVEPVKDSVDQTVHRGNQKSLSGRDYTHIDRIVQREIKNSSNDRNYTHIDHLAPSFFMNDSEDDDSNNGDEDTDSVHSEQTIKSEESFDDDILNPSEVDEANLLRNFLLYDMGDEFDDEIFMNLDVFGLDNERLKGMKTKAAPNFPCGPEITEECLVCFDTMKLRKRLCCDFAVCDECMEKYLMYEVERGVVKIECINGTCDSYVHRDEILGRLPLTMKEKYYRFLVDANQDPNIKTCPRCSHVYNRIEKGVLENHGKYGIMVECPDCKLGWCFECQAPWHTNVKCKDFQRGDDLLKLWAKEQHFGHQNAQKCPRCKIFIERKGGCDHMVCTKCNTSFCYRCGDRFVDLKFFGNHLSRLSPLGCKYNYKPDEPVKRRLVRGSILGAKLLGGVFLVGLGIAAGAVLVGASVVILPVLGGYKYHKFRKIRKRHRRQQKLFSLRTRRAMMESLREQAVMEYMTERYRTWPRQEQRDGPVHIGIQTGPSQQVDVTVHNPYHPDAPRLDGNLNSEILMDIKDDQGQYTRTKAEIRPVQIEDHGDFVLHVKTEYANPPPTAQPKENPDVVKDSERKDERETGLGASGKTSAHGSVSSRSSSSFSSRKSGANSKSKVRRYRRSSGPQSEKRETKKSENDHSTKKAIDLSKSSEPTPLPDLGLSRSFNCSMEEEADHLGDTEQNDPISHNETGCFLSLFSKKHQSLEKEKQSIPKIDVKENEQDFRKNDFKETDLSDCPDVVSCTLQAALRTQDNEQLKQDKPGYSTQSSCSSSDFDSSECFDHDPYLGMIASESYKTFL